MIISCRWLAKYIDLPPDTEKLIRTLTFSGIEVEGSRAIAALPESVVTARVVNAQKITGSDHLLVCVVDYGAGETTQVVCGAPNCHAGMISVLALPGTELPGIRIQKARLRGVESAGMLCSERELGVSDNHSGIIELDPDTPVGISPNELFELPDTILELEITPNRSDLLGYIGIARDLSASLGVPLRLPHIPRLKGNECKGIDLTLILEDEQKCPRYTARLMRGIKVQDSPQWLKTALMKSGLRPINNIVDITNYVMLETGHPLHAFDYDKLLPLETDGSHPAIVVRRARRNGEEFVALDGRTCKLDADDLVIADGQRASALAGVMGGKDTAISDSTERIVLEAANFLPLTIRSTSYKHKISTDSSYRFERHLSPAVVPAVSDRAAGLLLEVAGGEICNELYDAYPEPDRQHLLGVRPSRYSELIGYPMDEEKIRQYLESLGCEFMTSGIWQDGPVTDQKLIQGQASRSENSPKAKPGDNVASNALYFLIPPYRVDLTREEDLIEELARLDGYDKIPQKRKVPRIMDRHAQRIRRRILDYFVAESFNEVLNFSFSDPAQFSDLGYSEEELNAKMIQLVNPQSSNQSAMRISLLPHLLGNLSYNLNHGERNLKLMEMEKIYLKQGSAYSEPLRLTALLTGDMTPVHWKYKAEQINIHHVKGLVEGLLENLGIEITQLADNPQPWLVQADGLSCFSDGSLCASLGRLKSQTLESFGVDITLLKQDIWMLEVDVDNIVELTRNNKTIFSPLPRYPSVIRDISFLIKQSVPYAEIENAIRSVQPVLIRKISIFDEYRGKQVPEGLRSISLHIILQDNEKTLTDERVDQVIASVVRMLQDTWQINMR
jgi:phenylalanyl-tRNA synthetase beta chain